MLRSFWFLLTLFFVGLITSCSKSPSTTRFEGSAMTIPYCIQIGDPLNEKEIVEVEKLLLFTFSEIHKIYNNWNPDSEISRLNALPAHEKVRLSAQLFSFLQFVDEIVQLTEGKFDPTVAPLQLLWKTHLIQGTLPPQDKLNALKQASGWKNIHIKEGFFWKDHSLTALDLCGIAKGYCVDLLVKRLKIAGLTHLYVEWGGEIRTYGEHPTKRAWKVGIKGSQTIDLIDAAIATSGSYIQNWEVEGVSYTHIIDPKTGIPLTNNAISSTSVVAPTCAEADAIATALMLFPTKEEALAWAQKRKINLFVW